MKVTIKNKRTERSMDALNDIFEEFTIEIEEDEVNQILDKLDSVSGLSSTISQFIEIVKTKLEDGKVHHKS